MTWYVRDTESDTRAIVGIYVSTEEDAVLYERADGSIGAAPADCVTVEKYVGPVVG